jgi:hypothetical protein
MILHSLFYPCATRLPVNLKFLIDLVRIHMPVPRSYQFYPYIGLMSHLKKSRPRASLFLAILFLKFNLPKLLGREGGCG